MWRCQRRPGTPVDTIRIGVRGFEHGTAVQALPVDDYLLGSLLAEADLSDLDAAAVQRLAQVQAILARTYAFANLGRHADEGFDLCATTHCQVYRPVDRVPVDLVRTARDAIRATAGLLVTFGDQPINAVFHADCGGHTSDADAVWEGASRPYLRGTPDVFCLWEGPTKLALRGRRGDPPRPVQPRHANPRRRVPRRTRHHTCRR